MNEFLNHSDAGVKPVGRWTKRMKAVAHGVTVAVVFAAAVYTVEQVHLQFRHPGMSLPATVIHAPQFSLQASRVAAVLKRYTRDSSTADRIAGVIVDEGTRRHLDPALLVGVLLTEDETLDTMARSMVGARGLMQVMPEHGGKWGCGSSNLFDIESNICHGASILQDVMRTAPSKRVALLRYNGCVHSRNTPDCHAYPDRVMHAANQTTSEMLAFTE